MSTTQRVTELVNNSGREVLIRSLVVEPAKVHGRLGLRNILCPVAEDGPRAGLIERDTDVGISWAISGHPFEGDVGVTSPLVGELNHLAANEVTLTKFCQ